MNQTPQSADPGTWKDRIMLSRLRGLLQRVDHTATRELLVLSLITLFLLLYGLIPMFGGDQLGLVGADEPRYAQIAREMLMAHSEICHSVDAKVFPKSIRLTDLR